MVERLSVKDAYERGTVNWRYVLLTASGYTPVTIEPAESGIYWLTIAGVDTPAAVGSGVIVYAIPTVAERVRAWAAREGQSGYIEWVQGEGD